MLKKSRVYVIIDKDTAGKTCLTDIAKKIAKAKTAAFITQYRDKNSKREDILKRALSLRKILPKEKTLFIINDYIDIAKISGCDGLHLGQKDLSIETARMILGKDKIIGISCHSLKQAKDAQRRGADYIGIGPVFSTPTKPDYKPIGLKEFKKIRQDIRIPFFAIGGINDKNIREVLNAGANRVAVCRPASTGNPAKNLDRLQNLIT